MDWRPFGGLHRDSKGFSKGRHIIGSEGVILNQLITKFPHKTELLTSNCLRRVDFPEKEPYSSLIKCSISGPAVRRTRICKKITFNYCVGIFAQFTYII